METGLESKNFAQVKKNSVQIRTLSRKARMLEATMMGPNTGPVTCEQKFRACPLSLSPFKLYFKLIFSDDFFCSIGIR